MALIRKLVEGGCDVNAPDQRGERPLYQSACGGNLGEWIRYSLEVGQGFLCHLHSMADT